MSKVFIDTNILAYTLDAHDSTRREQCRTLLRGLSGDRSGVISTQVMQEFYVVATRKLNADPLTVKSILESFQNFEVVVIDPALILEAVDCSILSQISFWDALIAVAAGSAQCETLWTEDFSRGQIIRGARIENPLAPK